MGHTNLFTASLPSPNIDCLLPGVTSYIMLMLKGKKALKFHRSRYVCGNGSLPTNEPHHCTQNEE